MTTGWTNYESLIDFQ